jgi:signal transduction histidine kinase
LKNPVSIIKILFLFILLISNCNKPSNLKPVSKSKLVKLDSISIWIKKSKKSNLHLKNRILCLKKAYHWNNFNKNDTIKNKNLFAIALVAYNLSDAIFFKEVNSKFKNLSLKLKDTLKIAESHWIYGLYYDKNEVMDSSYYHYYKAYKYFKAKKLQIYSARMLYNMALTQENIKDYTGSEILTFRAIQIFKKFNKSQNLYNCYNLLGVNFKQIQEYDKSILYHKTALKYLNKTSNKEVKFERSLNNLGLVYQKQGNYKLAVKNFKKALENRKLEHLDINLYARLIDNLTYTRFLSGDTTNIHQNYFKALKIRDSIHFLSGIAISKLHLAEFYAKYADTSKAIKYTFEANKLALRANNNRDVLASLLLLSKLDKKDSRSYFNKYVAINDSLYANERKTRNKFTRIRFETDEYIEKTEKLSQQKLLISISSFIAIVILSLLYYIRIQRSKNKELLFEKQQQKANEEIYTLMLKQQSKMEEGRLKERKRISEDLHDGILGKIFGTRLALGFLNTKSDHDSVTKRKEHIDEIQNIEKEIRTISHELKNDLLSSEFDFIKLVENLLETQSKFGNFNFNIINNVSWDIVNNEIKINYYRIIQEAVQNINKYAKANNVNIEFDLRSNSIYLYIKDDGVGFITIAKNKGIGLTNMKSRVSKLNGNFKIKSIINKGTTINISVPLKFNNYD